ncbi:MAG: YchJ family protein [Myxococcota bacterium]
MFKVKRHERCPCGSGQRFDACCLPYHQGKRYPATPELLMRARYSAYCVGAVDFIMDTWDEPRWNSSLTGDSVQRSVEREELLDYCREVVYRRLEVLSTEPEDERGWAYVTFVATFQYGKVGLVQDVRERSLFEKQGGRWMYLRPADSI